MLVIEDIVDSGRTVSLIYEMLQKRNPKSLKLASLLFKPARLEKKVQIDFLGFTIEDEFVVGHGLDLAGKYREIPYIGVYSESN